MREQGRWNEQQVERGQRHQRAFPGRVAPQGQRASHEHHPDRDREPGRQPEIQTARLDGDEFRDQRQHVAEHKVGHREIAPERAETLENEFRVAAMGRDAKPHRHLLHHVGHDEGEQDERDEEADPVGGAGRRVGDHAGAVILAQHDQNARADQQPEQPQRTLGGPGLQNLQAVARPQQILAARNRPCCVGECSKARVQGVLAHSTSGSATAALDCTQSSDLRNVALATSRSIGIFKSPMAKFYGMREHAARWFSRAL